MKSMSNNKSESTEWILIDFLLCFNLCVLGEDLLQIKGQNGLLHTCMDPLPEVSSKQEVEETADHALKSFYPVSPTIDLQKVNLYKEVNSSGEDTPAPVPLL